MAGTFSLRGKPRQAFSAQVFTALAEQEAERLHAEENPPVPLWLEPPPYLTEREQFVWRRAVESRGVQWLKPIDTIALEEYCRTCTELHMLRPFLGVANTPAHIEQRWRRAHRQMMAYSSMLGLTVSQRLDVAKRGRNAVAVTKTDQLAQRATENAADPLLQGYGPPPDDLDDPEAE